MLFICLLYYARPHLSSGNKNKAERDRDRETDGQTDRDTHTGKQILRRTDIKTVLGSYCERWSEREGAREKRFILEI